MQNYKINQINDHKLDKKCYLRKKKKIVMKKILIIWLVLQASVAAVAQGVSTRYSIDYVKNHQLYLQGDAVNVIDVDVEWPSCLNGSGVDSLQIHLQRLLFRNVAAGWKEAQRKFLSGFGVPVNGQLAFLPDDDKFCYVSCQLREVGLWKGRFASFQTVVACNPHKESPQEGYHHETMFTYDMINNEVLHRDQILRMSRITESPSYSQRFSALLLGHLAKALSFTPSNISLGQNIGVGNEYLIVPFVAFGEDTSDSEDATAYLPVSELGDFLTKDFQKRLAMDPKAYTAQVSADVEEDGSDKVYETVDEKPEFSLPGTTYTSYIMDHLELPAMAKLENASPKVLVSFVVEKDGSIRDVSVVRPSSPSMDCEVVNLVRLMPRWKPGKLNGNPVRTRQFLPLTIKMQ